MPEPLNAVQTVELEELVRDTINAALDGDADEVPADSVTLPGITGLILAPCAIAGGTVDPTDSYTPLQLQAFEVITRLGRNQPKAALASAVDLVNDLCAEYGYNGSAQL